MRPYTVYLVTRNPNRQHKRIGQHATLADARRKARMRLGKCTIVRDGVTKAIIR